MFLIIASGKSLVRCFIISYKFSQAQRIPYSLLDRLQLDTQYWDASVVAVGG